MCCGLSLVFKITTRHSTIDVRKNRTSPEKIGPLVHLDLSRKYGIGPNLPDGFRTRNRNWGQLEFRCHMGPKMVFPGGGERTLTHEMTILAWFVKWYFLVWMLLSYHFQFLPFSPLWFDPSQGHVSLDAWFKVVLSWICEFSCRMDRGNQFVIVWRLHFRVFRAPPKEHQAPRIFTRKKRSAGWVLIATGLVFHCRKFWTYIWKYENMHFF